MLNYNEGICDYVFQRSKSLRVRIKAKTLEKFTSTSAIFFPSVDESSSYGMAIRNCHRPCLIHQILTMIDLNNRAYRRRRRRRRRPFTGLKPKKPLKCRTNTHSIQPRGELNSAHQYGAPSRSFIRRVLQIYARCGTDVY